jgi:urease accessory protein
MNLSLTTQRLNFFIAPHGCLFLLPDPVTCFKASSYNQIQIFHLAAESCLILLDWITSGRRSFGEDWSLRRYYSLNEIYVQGHRLARDAMLLENPSSEQSNQPRRDLATKLTPYSCFASLFLYGLQVEPIVALLRQRYQDISVMKVHAPSDLLWSFSEFEQPADVRNVVLVRVAARSTELVKEWLVEALRGLEDIVGIDVYRRTFQ